MSRFLDLARDVAADPLEPTWDRGDRPYRVITVTSNKGGVGKTTIATNLAVYLKQLRPETPVLIAGFDDQSTIDRMFAKQREINGRSISYALRAGTLASSIREGRYGVHYVPTSLDVSRLKRTFRDPFELRTLLERTAWEGVVVLDTKADLEILTQNAIAASDLVVVVVKDQSSLEQADRVYTLLDRLERPRDIAHVLLSMVNLRVKFNAPGQPDLLALLLSEIRRREYPLFESFISLSPKIESLHTNPDGTALPIPVGAPDSLVHGQMSHVAQDVLKTLDLRQPAQPVPDTLGD
jgi:cellulose biosynthesis protein BcsQ